jgi:GDP-fucose protein O-fucosyltransferase
MKEFLEREAMAGKMRDRHSGLVAFPPGNRTDWNGQDVVPLKEWLRNSTLTPMWGPDRCLAAFPASGKHEDVEVLRKIQLQIHAQGLLPNPVLDAPPPVDAETITRMRENLSNRQDLCVYDEDMRKERVVHFMCYHKMRVRLLVHFYAFLFFEDWREDLWMKRFMRDHVRYIDEIQCAAARIVNAMREHAKSKNASDPSGQFDTFHVRRGDFQFKQTRIEASEIVKNTRDILSPGSTIYVATDERDKSFFAPMKAQYDVKFMDGTSRTDPIFWVRQVCML